MLIAALSLAARFAPRGHIIACAHELEEGTCVEYHLSVRAPGGGTLGLGVYTAQAMGADPYIQPLCAWSDEMGVSELLWDEDADAVPLDRVHRILDPDLVYVSERQMGGGQGLGNPHGEHGEDCFDLSEVELSEGVHVALRDREEI